MLKAMSEQHWPLVSSASIVEMHSPGFEPGSEGCAVQIIEVFVAATQSSTLMYLSPTDSHATNVTVSEQIHKLPNGTVVATGALYGLADITKNGRLQGSNPRPSQPVLLSGDGKTRDTCSICLTNPINTALLPCGHTALCECYS